MKRRLLIHLPVFFLIGVVLSYLVAWGCLTLAAQPFRVFAPSLIKTLEYELTNTNHTAVLGLWSFSTFGVAGSYDMRAHGDLSLQSPLSRRERYGVVESIRAFRYGVDQGIAIKGDDVPYAIQVMLSDSMDHAYGTSLAGWPLLCVVSHSEYDPKAGLIVFRNAIEVHGYQNTSIELLDFLHLPYRPLCRNLSINSAFYGTLAYGFWLVPGPFKRRRRMRKGLCPKCKYNLCGNYDAGCSECGWGRQPKAVEVSET